MRSAARMDPPTAPLALPPILRTKVLLPQSHADLVARERLFQELDSGFRLGLTVVTAPPGYGKTTLVAEWVRRRMIPCAWLSLDAEDDLLPRFWMYVAAAFEELERGCTGSTLAMLRSPAVPSTEAVLTELLNGRAEIERECAR